MILVDTSVWVDHLRTTVPQLQALLSSREVVSHPFVIGELALGNLNDRTAVLYNMARLPGVVVARDLEVLAMVETFGLAGRGIGYVDAHLLAAARLTGCRLWTDDKRLNAAGLDLGVAYTAP